MPLVFISLCKCAHACNHTYPASIPATWGPFPRPTYYSSCSSYLPMYTSVSTYIQMIKSVLVMN